MQAAGRAGTTARQGSARSPREQPCLSRIAGPAATLAVTVALELFEAPVLSVLAALRLIDALRDEPRQ